MIFSIDKFSLLNLKQLQSCFLLANNCSELKCYLNVKFDQCGYDYEFTRILYLLHTHTPKALNLGWKRWTFLQTAERCTPFWFRSDKRTASWSRWPTPASIEPLCRCKLHTLTPMLGPPDKGVLWHFGLISTWVLRPAALQVSNLCLCLFFFLTPSYMWLTLVRITHYDGRQQRLVWSLRRETWHVQLRSRRGHFCFSGGVFALNGRILHSRCLVVETINVMNIA